MKRFATLLIALSLLAGTGCTGKGTAPSPAPAAETPAPVVSADPPKPAPPTSSVTYPATKLPLQPAPELLERYHLTQGAPLPVSGLFAYDLASGKAEGWRLKEGYLVASPTSSRWLTAHGVLVDRQTDRVWRYDPDLLQIAGAADGHLLLALKAEQRYVVADPDLQELATFPAKEGSSQYATAEALFAPDEARVLVRERDGALTLAETATGKSTTLRLAAAKPHDGFGSQPASLRRSRDGKTVHVLTTHFINQGEWRPDTFTDILTLDWTGKATQPLITVAGPNPWISPDGRTLAYDAIVDGKVPAVVVADAATGTPRQVALSASLCYMDGGVRGERWLSDSSGVVLRTRAGYGLLARDGGLKLAPALKDEPIPAPDRAAFALRDRSVVDLSGKVLAPAPVLTQADRPGDESPWGAAPGQLLITLPHGGHGGRCAVEQVLPPTIAPAAALTAPLTLQVTTSGDCLKLRAEPAGAEVKCLPHGTRLTVTPGKQPVPVPWGDVALVAGERWLHVKTATGEEGWVAFKGDYLGWTW